MKKSFRAVASTIVLFLCIVSFSSARAESPSRYDVPEDARHLETASVARRLLFLPLQNRTGDRNLDYLSYGVPSLLFSNMRTSFLIEGQPLPQRRLSPLGGDPGALKKDSTPAPNHSVLFLKAAILDFRNAGVRERQKGIPENLSSIPAKEKELQSSAPADLALKYGATWFVEGTVETVPLPPVYYVDPKGNRIPVTPELRARFQGKEVPREIAKLLKERRPEQVIVRVALRSFEKGADQVLWNDTFTLNLRNPYEGVDFEPSARRLEQTIRQENPHILRFRSAKSPGFVFLNDIFAGKTPLEVRLPSGRLNLRIEQDGCDHFRREIQLPGSPAEVAAPCDVARGRAVLDVTSTPAGADVFLDHEYIGKTPLHREDLLPGVHRVRVSAKEYIDGFYGVDLREGRPSHVAATLKKGDTVAYYTDPGYAIQDWTNEDLTLGLSIQSLFFYGGWAYSNARANAARDAVRSVYVPYFYPVPSYTLLEYRALEDARQNALRWERAGKVSAGLGIASLFAAGYFLYRGIVHDDRPFGELPETSFMFYLSPFSTSTATTARDTGYGFGLSIGF